MQQPIRISGAAHLTLMLPAQVGGPITIDIGPASNEPRVIVSTPELAAPAQRFTFIGEGCFRDALQPGWEFTPTLNNKSLPQADCERLAAECTLLGGGWALADDPMLLARLVSYDHHEPATFPELAADTRSDWYWTRKRAAWSSGLVWFVSFDAGLVSSGSPVYFGFARGVRRVPVSPGQ